MKTKLIALWVCITFLGGCATTSDYYQAQANNVRPEDVSTLFLNLSIDENKIYLVDTTPDSAERLFLAQSGTLAARNNIQTTQLPANVSAGEAAAGAAIGVVIGMQIVKMSQDAKEQSDANKKVEPIAQIIPKNHLVEMLTTKLRNEAMAQKTIAFLESSSEGQKYATQNTLLAEPELHFNFDLSRIEVKLNATVKDAVSQATLYQNTFEYWSKPIGNIGNCEENCALWCVDEAKLLTTYLDEGTQEVIAMLLQDIQTSVQKDQPSIAAPKTHKITSDRGTVFMRGSALKVGEDRVWVKDLRGNMRSIYGQLEKKAEL